jgi:hypothetical protein
MFHPANECFGGLGEEESSPFVGTPGDMKGCLIAATTAVALVDYVVIHFGEMSIGGAGTRNVFGDPDPEHLWE